MKRKEKWILLRKGGDFIGIGKKLGIDPAIIRIAKNRGMETEEDFRRFFNPSLEFLHDPALLRDSDKAVEILKTKISEKKKIRIIGDYDIDGICSTYILFKGLSSLGANVDYDLPHRIEDGYGLNNSLIDKAINADCDTIITCDNGIAAAKEIEYAKEKGMTVIVTDHHEVPLKWEGEKATEILPPADAVVDPKRSDCAYPFSGICGAVVAWKIIILLMKAYGKSEEEYMSFLEFAAFATIGDVMQLKDENRSIVYYGLRAIRKTKNKGLIALINQNNIKMEEIDSYTIGFVLGPCLNASGRLDTALKALSLLLSETMEEAMPSAALLVALNAERKDMTLKGLEEAKRIVENEGLEKDKVLVIYLPKVHESLAGIIAGKVREAYYKPTFIITKGETSAKGSGRSIEEFNMFENMSKMSEVFLKFGGHAMAAGLSLEEDKIDEFRKRINEACTLSEEDLTEKVKIDVDLKLGYISERLVNDINCLAPFGNGNESPLFAVSKLNAKKAFFMGKDKRFLKITLADDDGYTLDAVYFGDGLEMMEYYVEKYSKEEWDKLLSGRDNEIKMSLIFSPSVNEFRGNRSIELKIKNYI